MNEKPAWKAAAEEEIRLGLEERARGMEGRARVRARRAAGHILGEYFRRTGIPDPGPNAYERLKVLLAQPDAPAEARRAAHFLTMKVNLDLQLPPGVDLFTETQRLCQSLLGESLDLLPQVPS
ncbi:MAG TPA: hypothetical protein ENJ54_05820 [Chloroflexi bacterium]|nr:hypothetical protein [Chloroflexota bacterium]